MKQISSRLLQRYVRALREHIKPGSRLNLKAALALGRLAVDGGLETLDVARIHEQSLDTLALSKDKIGVIQKAALFFNEVITPILETHRVARQGKVELNRLNEMINRRMAKLVVANRRLQQVIVRRKSVEATLKQSGEHYVKLLKESLRVQKSLRQLTRHLLAAQENQRIGVSRKLQDEIVQTLLGLNVRLLCLKQEAENNSLELKNGIANTQQIVIRVPIVRELCRP
jgi:hypothetical protein